MKITVEITVRPARLDELERINEIRKEVNDVHTLGRPDIFRPGFAEEMRAHIYECFENKNSDVIAASIGEQICGYAIILYTVKPLSPYNLERRIYNVEEFGTSVEFRRCGVGSALMDYMKRDAQNRGYDKIELDMWEFNKGALEFYEAAGFRTYRRYMEMSVTGYPSREKALSLLLEAETHNPGPWIDHSIVTALCAERIAREGGMDSEKAYVLGLLHDIGRRFGFSYLRHVYDGCCYMETLDYPECARICLTHSFSVQDIREYVGKIDVTQEQLAFIEEKLTKIRFDDYDRLIQLCDAISMPFGAVSIEKRMNDVKSRYGAYPDDKWAKNMELKAYFSEKTGCDIELLTKGITSNRHITDN